MVESFYWKEELVRIAKAFEPVDTPSEWTERGHCLVERDLCVGFFIIRRMIELYKVSSITRNFQMKVYYSECMTDLLPLNPYPLDERLYDFVNERTVTKTPMYIANQFIHSCMSIVLQDETGNWCEVFTVSDRDRNRRGWRIPLAEVRRLFSQAANDYPSMIKFTRNENGGVEIAND